MASRDSLTNIRIAGESTKIAQETRRDSFAMKTIAVLTMLYLPATFVSSVFGTNFFAMSSGGPGRPSTVISRNWWIGVLVAAGLTMATMGVWVWVVRKSLRRKSGDEGDGGNLGE
jgi:Mg2+ and Co2+ transporter CorA